MATLEAASGSNRFPAPHSPQAELAVLIPFCFGFSWLLPTHSPHGLWYQCLEHGVKLLWALLLCKMASLKLQETHSRTSTLCMPSTLQRLSVFFPPSSSSSWLFTLVSLLSQASLGLRPGSLGACSLFLGTLIFLLTTSSPLPLRCSEMDLGSLLLCTVLFSRRNSPLYCS